MDSPDLEHDLLLARAAVGGDPGAREAVARACLPAMLRLLRTFTRNREDAEDLAQTAILRALKALDRYDGRAPLRAWTLAIAVNEGRRHRRLRPWLTLSLDVAVAPHADRSDDAVILAHAIARLPLAQREAFALCAVEGLEASEAALVLGIPEGTVKSRVHHARRRLRAILATSFPEYHAPERVSPEPNHV